MILNHSRSSLMASSSSSSPRTWRYRVFTSFHGPDVRKTFLSHLRKTFNYYGITMFDDQGIVRSQIIAPALKQAIRESRISVVVLSKNYASSSWCLDELLEILKCTEDAGQIVMTVFYGVDPSHVRNQLGEFGIAFYNTCARKTEDQRRQWSQALTYVGNIAGEHFQNCNNEAEMIENIAKDVSNKLNVTPSRDFEGMVGLDAHLRKIESLLDLDNDRVKIVGISGPAGIGKSTIARALHNQLYGLFPRHCFMDNLRGCYHSGSDIYTSKLGLQRQLLSKIFNQNCMAIGHLGAIEHWLHDQKVLIILDDVECLDQLEALANVKWFGPRSRVLVTAENKEILQQHDDINDIYHVGFPSESEALKIFCQSAFKDDFPPYEFEDLAYEVANICGNLPLGLHVLGSLLKKKTKAEWRDELPRLKNCLDRRIESVLKVGYESLDQKDQDLFLFIAVFFNYKHVDHVTSMLAKTNLNVSLGLKNLANRCLINCENSKVVMHHLLQVMARRQVISTQEPWKRKILADARQICYDLEHENGNGSILGISFDVAEINKLKISRRAFERMYNLLFLEVYKGWPSQEVKLHIPEEMEFLPRLRLLRWDAYPRKSLPLRFCPENLIELDMADSQLEKLWEGTQPLANLKNMNLCESSRLKELPDLSNARNLERLNLRRCSSLLVLPSSISNLHKLVKLDTWWCESLETIPTLANLTSLRQIDMQYCSRLRNFPKSIRHCSRIENVYLGGSRNLKTFSTHLPTSVSELNLYESGIKRITDCIKGLHNLELLELTSCKRLVSLPKLPSSLRYLEAINCESLERVSGPLNTPNADLYFINCFKLDGQARQTIIQRSFVNGFALLPGREVPAEFDYRARGNSLTIPYSNFNRFKVCVVLSPVEVDFDEATTDEDDVDEATTDEDDFYEAEADFDEATTDEDDNNDDNELKVSKHCINIDVPRYKHLDRLASEHLFIFYSSLPFIDPSKVSKKTVLEFSSHGRKYFDIIECGIQILTDETDRNNNGEDGGNDEASDEEEAFDNEDYVSESGEASDEEDDEEGDKSDLFFYHILYNFKLP